MPLETSRFPLRTLWLAACLLIAAFFGYQVLDDSLPALQSSATVTPVSHVAPDPAAPQLLERPIEEIQVGERVHVEAGYGDEDYEFGADVEPATWRKLTLRVPKPEGGHVDVELLRPLAWIEAQGATPGGTFEISLHEMGVEGPAYVVAIAACPPVGDGPGRVVTGTFHHSSAEILDLSIEGVEPIGVTANHRFWSADRQEFVRADELQPGEQVRTLDGRPRVIRTVPRIGREPVYNLEIQVDHLYHVSARGVLVHNTYAKPKFKPKGTKWADAPTKARTQPYPDNTGRTRPLSISQQKAIRSLNKRIAEHQAKLAEFKANPTPHPATLNSPQAIQQQSIHGRIGHLEDEIQTFSENIEKIRRGEL